MTKGGGIVNLLHFVSLSLLFFYPAAAVVEKKIRDGSPLSKSRWVKKWPEKAQK